MKEYFDKINAHVNKCANFTSAELAVFNALLKYKEVSKKTILLREGEACHFEAYIISGCIRNYYINENGAQVVLQFGIEDWWVSDVASFNDGSPSKMYIETLEDCKLFLLSPETKEELLNKVPKFERVYRLMLQRNLTVTQNRLINNITKSATDKYLDFISRYPTIPQRVAQHYIASYLGVSAEFLSKIRAKLAKK